MTCAEPTRFQMRVAFSGKRHWVSVRRLRTSGLEEYVVFGRTESAGEQYYIGATLRLGKGLAYLCRIIVNGRNLHHLKPPFVEACRYPRAVGIDYLPDEQFVADSNNLYLFHIVIFSGRDKQYGGGSWR